jgi:hypothetical protein
MTAPAPCFFELNGQPRPVRVTDRSQVAGDRRGDRWSRQAGHVGAPMPGTVATVAVSAGHAVVRGEVLLTLEAMKMETAVRAERDGRVVEVLARPRRAGGRHDLLLILEERTVVSILAGSVAAGRMLTYPGRCAASQRSSVAPSMAPLWRATSRPPLKTISVGMLRHSVAGCDRPGILGIELSEARRKLVSRRRSFEDRSHRTAGRTPRRPEVNHQRQRVCGYVTLEVRGSQRERLPVEDRSVALRAFRPVIESLAGYADQAVAGFTYDLDRVRHVCSRDGTSASWGRRCSIPSPARGTRAGAIQCRVTDRERRVAAVPDRFNAPFSGPAPSGQPAFDSRPGDARSESPETAGIHGSDYYEVMVSRDAQRSSSAPIAGSRVYHPDVSKEPDAEAKFKELQEAHEVLKDPEKRAAYDQLGADWRQGQDFRPPPDWGKGFEFSSREFGGGRRVSSAISRAVWLTQSLLPPQRRAGRILCGGGQDYMARVEIDLGGRIPRRHAHDRVAHCGPPDAAPDEATLKVTIPPGVTEASRSASADRAARDRRRRHNDISVRFRPHPFRSTVAT